MKRRTFLALVLSWVIGAVAGFRRRRVSEERRAVNGGREALYYERDGEGR